MNDISGYIKTQDIILGILSFKKIQPTQEVEIELKKQMDSSFYVIGLIVVVLSKRKICQKVKGEE